MDIIKTLTDELSLQPWQVEHTVELLDEGNTIPFIARYRKEAHGSLDDQTIRKLSERLTYLRNLDKRRDEISASITEQEKMTPEIENAIAAAVTLVEVEDIYFDIRGESEVAGRLRSLFFCGDGERRGRYLINL